MKDYKKTGIEDLVMVRIRINQFNLPKFSSNQTLFDLSFSIFYLLVYNFYGNKVQLSKIILDSSLSCEILKVALILSEFSEYNW